LFALLARLRLAARSTETIAEPSSIQSQ
jgi:hypothetical protein